MTCERAAVPGFGPLGLYPGYQSQSDRVRL